MLPRLGVRLQVLLGLQGLGMGVGRVLLLTIFQTETTEVRFPD